MTSPLWTSADAIAATGGETSADWDATGISIDTRSLQPGDLFVALQDQRDGHEFAQAAFAAGASAALVDHELEGCGPQLVVKDVLPALEAMGIAARARSGAIRTAVTGSVGKTSVKEMLARIYHAAGAAHWSVKSFNNHWGVPLTLARMPENTERAVFEIGMNTPGEIGPRSAMVRPNHAIITMIAGAHLEGMGSIEAVAKEKAAVFSGLEIGGSAILPADDNFHDVLKTMAREHQPKAKFYAFGRSATKGAIITSYETDGETSTIGINVLGETASTNLNAVGEHWAWNAAIALLAAKLAGIDASQAAEALTGYTPPPGRGTSETLALPGGGEITLIDDAYNANPESMRAALISLNSRPAGRRILALGEMLEIGEMSEFEHAALSHPVIAAEADIVFLAGAEMQHLADALPGTIQQHLAVKANDLFTELKNTLRSGDLLLIKGSNASGMGKLADQLRQWSAAADKQLMESGVTNATRAS